MITGALLWYVRHTPLQWKRLGLFNRVLEPRLAQHPRKGVAKTRTGLRIAADTTDLIQRALYGYGDWGRDIGACIERLNPGDTFIDVGANIGYFSLLAAQRGARVIGIEPSPTIAKQLAENAALNGIPIEIIEAAVGSEPATLPLYPGPRDNSGGTSLIASAWTGWAPEAEVRCDSLPALVGDALREARLIKIDVQGYEYEVMAGLQGAELHPDVEFVLEVHPDELRRHGLTISEWLAPWGLHPYLLDESFPNPWREQLGAMALDAITGEVDLLLSPIDLPRIRLSPREQETGGVAGV